LSIYSGIVDYKAKVFLSNAVLNAASLRKSFAHHLRYIPQYFYISGEIHIKKRGILGIL
jgi:hypothetical protein